MNEIRINIGCGTMPTKGWINLDGSPSVILSKYPLFVKFLKKLSILNEAQCAFITFIIDNNIRYANAIKTLQFESNSVDVVYSSHMFEHLNKIDGQKFLQEVHRVLMPTLGIVRIAVPDIRKISQQFLNNPNSNAADVFMESTGLCDPPRFNRFFSLFVKNRNHQWMYDGDSLSLLLLEFGFVDVKVVNPGMTSIQNYGDLNLNERESDSVYVEARKKI